MSHIWRAVVCCFTVGTAVGWTNDTLVADALGWYVTWKTIDSPDDEQTCAVERSEDGYKLWCRPVSVLIALGPGNGDGECVVYFMRALHQFDAFPAASAVVAENEGRLLQCGEPRGQEKPFTIRIHPRKNEIDQRLTRQARDQAMQYFKRGSKPSPCLLRFPYVRTGDPFFHVYQVCGGEVTAVWEFTIRGGRPAEFAHWTYSKRRRNLPDGSANRLARPDLWFESPTEPITPALRRTVRDWLAEFR